ncbi:hypothetical protein COR52_27015 [Vibrio mediterranei]|uniref:Uncharacterized protein n=2 Tax=Vibrio mediterranei TaxID=689 RepID=A0ABX5DB29_9VIBR|nr:hypothetical protein COR52_27015 [Vibrio mediterranei]PRQ66899.1 hypothetical protein COR51_14060 [Vibrio mediterranei]
MLGNNVGWSNLAWDKLDWSKFNGSQLANTYTPILAFFTLIFLVRQQNTTEKIIVAQQQREDLTYYLDVLLPYLQETKIEDGRSVYEWFKEDVARCSDEDAEQFTQQFLKLAEQSMEISTTWYAVWDSLEDVKKNTVLKLKWHS